MIHFKGVSRLEAMEPTSPLYTADLFPPLHQELIGLLHALSPEDWGRPTVAGEWEVRDVVAHLLDVDLRKLSVNLNESPLRGGDRPLGPEGV